MRSSAYPGTYVSENIRHAGKRKEERTQGPKGQMICCVYVRAEARTYPPVTFSVEFFRSQVEIVPRNLIEVEGRRSAITTPSPPFGGC
jgi:hypothetical protein